MERPKLKSEFKAYHKNFGLINAIRLSILPRLKGKLFPSKNKDYIGESTAKFIKSNFGEIITKYKSLDSVFSASNLENDFIIWTFWWQGIDQMPPIIHTCYQSILNNANGHQVILLNNKNIKNWVNFPDYIWKKVDNGIISLPHLSDLVSLYLLSKYGGLWVDATIFATAPIKLPQQSFTSPRMHLDGSAYCGFKYTIAVLAGSKENIIFKFMLEILLNYWRKYNIALHYLFFDDFMKIGYNNLSNFKKQLDNNALYCDNLYDTRHIMNSPYNQESLDKLIKDNLFISLTYRTTYFTTNQAGALTLFGALSQLNENSQSN